MLLREVHIREKMKPNEARLAPVLGACHGMKGAY